MTDTYKAELAATKRELYSSIRTKLAAMTSTERAAYVQRLTPDQRRLLKTITTGVEARAAASGGVSYCSPEARMMDERMGLTATTPGVVRTKTQLIAGAGVVDTKPQPSAAGTPRPSGALTRAAGARTTRLSPHAGEMDRAMGLDGGGSGVTRTATSLIFGAGGARK